MGFLRMAQFRAAILLIALGAASAELLRSKRANPLFSEDHCVEFHETMVKLGGPVPPAEHVSGCESVCAKVKEMKEYWHTGPTATYACEQGKKFGCAWQTTTLADI